MRHEGHRLIDPIKHGMEVIRRTNEANRAANKRPVRTGVNGCLYKVQDSESGPEANSLQFRLGKSTYLKPVPPTNGTTAFKRESIAAKAVIMPPIENPDRPIRSALTSGCCSRKVMPRRAATASRNQFELRGLGTASIVYSSGKRLRFHPCRRALP